MRLEIHFEAREEFLQPAQFYEAQVPGLGQRFINEIERCQKALLDTPPIGQPYGCGISRWATSFPIQSCTRFLRTSYLCWRTLMARVARAIGVRGPSANNRFERSRGRIFVEPRRESMIGIKCLRLTPVKPRVAQPHR